MLILNTHIEHGKSLGPVDTGTLGTEAAAEAERFLSHRVGHKPTPLLDLQGLAKELHIEAIHLKDEGQRLGLGSFKALGGSYAVIRLVLEHAAQRLGRSVDITELQKPEVRAIASELTVTCATDGNHGRSVAQGAQLVGAKCTIFVHAGVSNKRVDAIARFGARMIRVQGNYDESVAEASRVAEEKQWIVVSDTSWSGYERIPRLVMQGYTAMLREAVRQLPQPPTHIFVQAGVGGVAAAVAGHSAIHYGEKRPFFVVVEPSRAACLHESARVGRPIKIDHGEPTVMAMLECYEPSLVAWRILSRAADAFITVDEDDAIDAMKRLAAPVGGDAAIVAGESGGVGLAGLIKIAADPQLREKIGLEPNARVFLINTEGATDPQLYEKFVGVSPDTIRISQDGLSPWTAQTEG